MIRVHVTPEALGAFRIVHSPLWELLGSLSCLAQERTPPWPYSDWRRTAERALTHRPGGELVAWARQLGTPVPVLLTPAPPQGASLDDEIAAALRLIPTAWDRRVGVLASGQGPWASNGPAAWCRWFERTATDYWSRAVAPYWAAIQSAVGDDVSVRGRGLATQGAEAVLNSLDSRVHFAGSVLEVSNVVPDRNLTCTSNLLAVPLIFGRRLVRCVADGTGAVAVSYQSHGTALLGKPRPVLSSGPVGSADDRLALMLGKGRAAVLRGLAAPTTTSELADALGMSASTVSQHLNILLAADVVSRRRVGLRVIYSLDRAGMALLKYLDGSLRHAAG